MNRGPKVESSNNHLSVAINEKFEKDENNAHHAHHSDIIDATFIYESPEPLWTWSYSFPDTVYNADSNGLSEEIIDNLTKTYTSCGDAWWDLLYWMGIVYGDIYGNKGINTSVFYLWNFMAFKFP